MNFILVFAGGGLGCMLRYLIGLLFQKSGLTLPWGTFVSNLSACIIFAATLWFISSREAGSQTLRLLLLTGFCGGLSTFSSFGHETFLLLKQGMLSIAFMNILFNTACCLLVFYLFHS